MRPGDVPVPDADVLLREEFDDWALLFHPLTAEVVGAGPVGVAIWKLLDGRRTAAQIAAEVRAGCEDAPALAAILDDTLAFLTDLERRLFVRTRKAG